MFAAQEDTVNEAQTAMKRLPATCAIQALQGGGGGVAVAPAGGQMLVVLANPVQNPPLPNVPVGDDDDTEVILFYYSNKAVLEKQKCFRVLRNIFVSLTLLLSA